LLFDEKYEVLHMANRERPLLRQVGDNLISNAAIRLAFMPFNISTDILSDVIINKLKNNTISRVNGLRVVTFACAMQVLAAAIFLALFMINQGTIELTASILYFASTTLFYYQNLVNYEKFSNRVSGLRLSRHTNRRLAPANNRAIIRPRSTNNPIRFFNAQDQYRLTVAWKDAIATHNISPMLASLELYYFLDKRVTFIPAMHQTYADNSDVGKCYGTDVSEDLILELEQNHKDLCCPVSGNFMRIPVYITYVNNGATTRNYFDFINILKALETTNYNPLNRIVIKNLNDIKYDAEKFQQIQKLVNSSRSTQDVAPLIFSGPADLDDNPLSDDYDVEAQIGIRYRKYH
jgi:hypothetical protein